MARNLSRFEQAWRERTGHAVPADPPPDEPPAATPTPPAQPPTTNPKRK